MRMFAAIVPPRDIIDEVNRVVESVTVPAPVEQTRGPVRSLNVPTPAQQTRALVRRFSGRGSGRGAQAGGRAPVHAEKDPVRSTTDELDTLEPARMYLPISAFGNVTLGDSIKLTHALRAEVATWGRPHLAFSGGAALEFPGDDSVWAKLDGDVDALMVIGRGVPKAVQRLGFFVDRRQFRPWLSVGTITSTTSAPFLERLVAALDDFRGEPWTGDAVHLMKWLPENVANDTFEPLERLPLG